MVRGIGSFDRDNGRVVRWVTSWREFELKCGGLAAPTLGQDIAVGGVGLDSGCRVSLDFRS